MDHAIWVRAVRLNAHGMLLASGSNDGTARVTDVTNGQELLRIQHRGAVWAVKFSPDGRTLFCAVQHPADEKGSTYARPSTRWPDFDDRMPPRPSVLAIVRLSGRLGGSPGDPGKQPRHALAPAAARGHVLRNARGGSAFLDPFDL